MLTRRRAEPDDGWTSAVSSGFAMAGFLALVFVAFTLLAMGPFVRYDAYFNAAPPPQEWVPVLHVLDRVGQRAIALPILGVVLYHVYRRTRSWRPVLLSVVSVFALNLLVLILKVTLGRGSPVAADPSFFQGGIGAYPSGHSSNIVLYYGLATYVLSRYLHISRRTQTLLWGGVVFLSVTMVTTSLTLNWHWFADLVAGLIVGGIVLELTVTLDRMVPAHVCAVGGLNGLKSMADEVLRLFRVRRPQVRQAPPDPYEVVPAQKVSRARSARSRSSVQSTRARRRLESSDS